MKKSGVITILLFLLFQCASAYDWTDIHSPYPVPARIQLVSSDNDRIVIRFNIDGFSREDVMTPSGKATVITVGNATPLLIAGSPDLPKLTASVIIPDEARMDVKVIASSYTDYEGLLIAPSKGNLLRDIDPSSVPYNFGRIYGCNGFFPGKLAELGTPYIMRDHRGQTVMVNPFQYNPVTRTLRVYSEIIVEVKSTGDHGLNPFHRNGMTTLVNSEFQRIYDRHFLNAGRNRYNPLDDNGNMLIISYGDFIETMQPFVDWKIKTGMPVQIVDVATIGDAQAIKTYVENYYNEHGLTFLLLVGDEEQVPSNPHGEASLSDNSYGYISGNDSYPELIVGRFSAETTDEAVTQVQRTLAYEQNPSMASGWLSAATGIASSLGPGDDDEYDYQHVRNLRTQLLGYTYSQCAELYDGSQGGEDASGNPTPLMVADQINAGSGLILYTGHGSSLGWGTSGFSSGNVNALTNTGMWPFIWSVACWNGLFGGGTCFAEAWLRATDSAGHPTGAVAALMSTISQAWTPPMEGQDEMVSIMVESYQNNIKRTFGGISVNGCMKMNDSYGYDGTVETDAWTIFGDPSLMIRTAAPQTMTVTHPDDLFIGSSALTIYCDREGALAALTLRDHQILGTAAISEGTGVIIFEPLTAADTLSLVLTAYNCVPYTAEIRVIQAEGPYLVFDACQVNDATGNGNGMLDYGENVGLSLSMKNVGTEDAGDVTVTLASGDPYVTISDNYEEFGNISSGGSVTRDNAFAFAVSPDVADNHPVIFTVEAATPVNNTWSSSFVIKAHAPDLELGSWFVDDQTGNQNGKLDPDETVGMVLTVANMGSSDAYDVQGELTSEDVYVTLQQNTLPYGTVDAGGTAVQTFTVTADDATPMGHVATFIVALSGTTGITVLDSFNIIIGQIPAIVVDLDGDHSSGPVLFEALQSLGVNADYQTTLPEELTLYSSVFVCLGTYPAKHILTGAEGLKVANYLDAGGSLYMEGADTWAFDDQTAAQPMFYINGVNDGSNDMTTLEGQNGTFTQGMTFVYSGENNYMDHIEPVTPAFMILMNTGPVYGAAVAYDAGTYKTVGTSFEFSGLKDGPSPSTRQHFLSEVIDFLGVGVIPTGTVTGTVTDVKTGLPLAGAKILVGSYWTLAGSDGTYSGVFPAGEWPLCASAGGYETGCGTIAIYPDSIISQDFALLQMKAPYNLHASLSVNILTLTWDMDAMRDFQHYSVYRSKNSDAFTLLVNTTEKIYTDVLSATAFYHYFVTAMYANGTESFSSDTVTMEYSSTGIPVIEEPPEATKLGNNYPNPFTTQTTLTFALKESNKVLITVFRPTGETVRILVDETLNAGDYKITWDGTDDSGRSLPAGIYLYQMKAGGYLGTKRMVLIR